MSRAGKKVEAAVAAMRERVGSDSVLADDRVLVTLALAALSAADCEPGLIYDDLRQIRSIYYHGPDAGGYTVNFAGVTRIIAYREHGLSDFTPFFAVYQGDHLQARVPAHAVTVTYAKEQPNDP
jgi:hypothetical protein